MNCKPGDLAFVIRSTTGSNIGKVCQVLSYGGQDKDGENWVVEFSEAIPAVIQSSGEKVLTRRMWAPDAWLRPIRDNPGNEEWFKSAPLTTEPVAA